MKQGRDSLFVGNWFLLSACLFANEMLPRSDPGTWANVLRQSLNIAGWVAMWRPMEIYFYDWWPVRRRGRIFAKLSHMPVEVIPKNQSLIRHHCARIIAGQPAERHRRRYAMLQSRG